MSAELDKLRRLVADETGEADDADVEARVDDLDDLHGGAASPDQEGDLAVLSALASDTRYDIVRVLRAADDGLAVCELDAIVDVQQSAVSHALGVLREAGLVEARSEGNWRYYETTDRAEAIVDAVDASR